MAKRPLVEIKLASISVWEFSHYTTNGNPVLKYTITDEATGTVYKGTTRANADFIDHVGRTPAKLSNVRLVGKVMADASRYVLI